MKKIRKIIYVLLMTLLVSGFLTEMVPHMNMIMEVQAATKPSKPTLVSATASGTSKIIVKWKSVKNADGYYVYRKTDKTKWTKIKTITKRTTVSFTDTGRKKGTVYYYTVRAYKKSGGKTLTSSYDTKGIGCVVLTTPTPVSAKVTGAKEITFTWKKMKGVVGYRVYRKTNNGKWILQKKITGDSVTSYVDKAVTSGDKYRYTVRTYMLANGKAVLSGYNSTGKTVTMKIPAPGGVSAKAVGTDVEIKWNTVKDAEGYRVYRKKEGAADWERLITTSDGTQNSYTDKTAEAGYTYYYTVRAYINGTDKKIWGSYDKTGKKIQIKLPAPELISAKAAGETSIILSWGAVEGADGYRAYMKENGEWTRLVTLSGNDALTYTVSGLKAATTYNFTARAYKLINGTKVWGKYSTTGIYGSTECGELKLNTEKLYIHKGFSKTLEFEGVSVIPQWSSSNPDVARVNANGKVYGQGIGKAIITASINGEEYHCEVIVEYPSVRAEKEIIEIGESTYINVTGTEREAIWGNLDNEYVDVEVINDKKVKVTGKAIGFYQLKAEVGDFIYYPKIIVKGELNIPTEKIELEVGEKKEIYITGTYDDLRAYMNSPYVAEFELTEMYNGQWKLSVQGTAEGTTSIVFSVIEYADELKEQIQIVVKDNGSLVTKNFKLKQEIESTGVYSDGWYSVGYAGYIEDVPEVLYTWSISYQPTSEEFEYGLALTTDEDILAMTVTGNPVKSSAMKVEYVYYNEAANASLLAESSLNINTYSGQKLAFKIVGSEGISDAEINELMNVASESVILGFEGWNDHVLKAMGLDVWSLGFKAYPKN